MPPPRFSAKCSSFVAAWFPWRSHRPPAPRRMKSIDPIPSRRSSALLLPSQLRPAVLSQCFSFDSRSTPSSTPHCRHQQGYTAINPISPSTPLIHGIVIQPLEVPIKVVVVWSF
ncbi:hypothetical protein ZWY2020_037083 [Hordeum vulgare]|nr:hypothetical protein ZWY2020_037083 [Hordeum vulgare]